MRAPNMHAELKREQGNAAGPLHQHGLAGLQAALGDQGLPDGERGAGQGRSLLVGQMLRRVHQPLLIEPDEFGKHSVHVAAELADARGLVEIAAEPALPEGAEHPVADLGAGHALADCDDFADAIRGRHQGKRKFERVSPGDHVSVAVIERYCARSDHHFAEPRLRFGPVDQFEVVEPELTIDFESPSSRSSQQPSHILRGSVGTRRKPAKFEFKPEKTALAARDFAERRKLPQ